MFFRFIFFLFSFFCAISAFAETHLLDKVVAVVNSQVITQSELNQQLKITRAQLQAAGVGTPPASQLHEQALNQLIDLSLQKSIAKKAHIQVSEPEVNKAIAQIAAQNHISVAQLQKSLAAQGMPYSVYWQQIHDQILLQQVQQSLVAPKVKITAQDIANASNTMPAVAVSYPSSNAQYHVIDIKVPTRKAAEKLLAKLHAEKKLHSLLHNNPAIQVTDLGFRPLSQFPNIFVNSLQSLRAGEFSPPIQAPNGVHILKLVAIQGNPIRSAPGLTPQQVAYQRKYEETLQQWLRTLRSESYIKIIS